MAIRFDKFTVKAQEAVQRAQRAASDRGQQVVEPVHLLEALLDEKDGIVQPMLAKLGVDVGQVERIVRSEIDRLPRVSGVSGGEVLSNDTKATLEAAQTRAEQMRDQYTSTEHILLALAGVGKTKDVFQISGVSEKELLQALRSVRGGARVDDPNPEGKYQSLEKYGRDLVLLAKRGKLDPVIG
ncbi:MAG: Clp protease N-terminal domain-containing protein, partial [Planctomycetia bacterium]